MLPLCNEGNPKIYLEKKRKMIKKNRHIKLKKKVKIKLEMYPTGT